MKFSSSSTSFTMSCYSYSSCFNLPAGVAVVVPEDEDDDDEVEEADKEDGLESVVVDGSTVNVAAVDSSRKSSS